MADPRLSASVIVYRENPGLEVFWVLRSPQMVYQGGFHAFPGGQLRQGEDVRQGAVREFEEETGVRLDSSALVDVGRWVTPPFLPIRFDTQFFLTRCPDGSHPSVVTTEHEDGEWTEPAAALDKWRNGLVLMAPPIRHALLCLREGLNDIATRMRAAPPARGEPASEVEIRPGISLVPLRTPTLPPATHTNCYIVGRAEVIVIDPASPYADEQSILDHVLESRAARIREIWLTHLHRDHVGGVNHLRRRWNVPVAAHAITARDLAGVVDVDRVFSIDEQLDLNADPPLRLHVYHTPGHARGHVCIFEERFGSLITGDLMAGFGTIVIDPPEGHMATYMASLERMRALPVTALFPSHGPVMANAKTKIEQYIDHRRHREENILAAYRRGMWEPGAIVREVYTDVNPALYDLAERSVLAHLEKLREEGRL